MPAVDSFIAYLTELGDTASFVSGALRARQEIGRVGWGASNELDIVVKRFVGLNCVEDRIYQGLLVSAQAGFEQFVTGLQEDGCILINEGNLTASQLEARVPGFLKRFRRTSGIALSKIDEPRDYWAIDFDALVRNLATTAGELRAAVDGKVFVVEGGVFNSDGLKKRLAAFGFEVSWDDVGRDSAVADSVGETGVRAAGKAAKEILDELSRRRNLLAHTQGAHYVGYDDLTRFLGFYRAFSLYLSSAFHAFLRGRLAGANARSPR